MKEQRKQILTAEAVEANLGEVEGARSRFIDAGFINTGGRNVDYAGKFLNAVKAGIGAYQSTSDYKQQERDHKTNALADAKTHLDDVNNRAEGIHTADLDAFYMQEMQGVIGSLDDGAEGPLAEIYKTTFSNAVTEKYMSLATANQVLMGKEKRAIDAQTAVTNIVDWGFSHEDVSEDLLYQGFTGSEVSKVWAEGKLVQINKETASFEKKWTLYEEAMSQKESEILKEIKESGKTRNEWLLSKSEDPEKQITIREIVENRLDEEGMVHPITSLDALHKEALNQEGSDGVGKISELNNTAGTNLLKSVKESRERIAGIKTTIGLKHLVSTGRASITSVLDSTKTGNASVDELTKKKVMSHVIQQSSVWLATIFANAKSEGSDPVAAKEAAVKLDSTLRMNPALASQIIGNQANDFNARFREVVDSGNPTDLAAFLYEAHTTLYDANVGQATRDAIEKAVPGFSEAVLLSRINVEPFHIHSIATQQLPTPTKEEYQATLGEEALGERIESAKKYMPWASPTTIIKTAEMAIKFDYAGIGFDANTFFELHGDKMSTKALSPSTEMETGQDSGFPSPSKMWDNLFGGTRVPTSGAWELLATKDATTPGYTQGMLHYILANTDPALKEAMVDKLGMEAKEHTYAEASSVEKLSFLSLDTYNTLNFTEGWDDDFQPIRIRRFGSNEWAVELTTKEWLDNVPLIGDAQPWIGATISNSELREFSGQFDTHLENVEQMARTKDQAEQDFEDLKSKQRKENNPSIDIYQNVGWEGLKSEVSGEVSKLKEWWDNF